MYYLVGKHANVERRIITEEHPVVQMHLKEADKGWDAEKIIKWMWGIVKKSENILDLIDRDNDLLKVGALGYQNIIEAKSINGSFKNMKKILAIYKPNSKGDYIKVWERRE